MLTLNKELFAKALFRGDFWESSGSFLDHLWFHVEAIVGLFVVAYRKHVQSDVCLSALVFLVSVLARDCLGILSLWDSW